MPSVTAIASSKKTIPQPFRLIPVVATSHAESRARSGRGRIRDRGDCGVCAV